MFLKRSLVLLAGVLLFIVAFIVYFNLNRAQTEELFRQERIKFGVEGTVLTASEPASPAPASSSATAPAPAAKPAGEPAPDATPAPAPTTPDATPPPTAPSTMNSPRDMRSPFFALAGYRPGDGMRVQFASSATDTVSSPAEPTGTGTNAPTPEPAPAPAATTTAPAVTTPAPAPAVARSPVPSESSVIVLLYHQFKPPGVPIPAKFEWTMNQDVFESEMKYIHDNGYHVVPLSDVLRFIRHEITLPPGSVAITIDDGYKSAIVLAAPILKKYGYPWTFFIYPDFITEGEGPGAASWKDLLDLQAQGVDIECHSMTHPKLTSHRQKFKGVMQNLSPEEYDAWLTNETSGAKALIEQRMGKPVNCFAYPYGLYDKEVEAKTIAAGFEAIFTVADNPVHSTTDLHSIGRYTITRPVERDFAAYLRQSALSLTQADPEPGATISNPQPVITAVLSPLGNGSLDPNSLETSIRDFGDVKHDFDPRTNTVRLYLPRPLISPVVLVSLRVKDAATGLIMVANWHFNYEPGPNASHAPIAPPNNAPSPLPKAPAPTTNAPVGTGASAAANPGPAPQASVR